MSDVPRRAGLAIPEAAIALALIGLAAVVFWQTTLIPTSAIYAKVGPRIFPFMAGAALGVLGIVLLLEALRGGWQPIEEGVVALDWRSLALVLAGLVANVLLLGAGSQRAEELGLTVPSPGFTIASTMMFVLVAAGFGSRNPLRDALIGAAFALIAYFGFAKTLGIDIGSGIVEKALDPYVEQFRAGIAAVWRVIATFFGEVLLPFVRRGA